MLRVAIVAGESSGDQLGASLIAGLRRAVPDVQISAVAGPAMRAAGCEVLARAEELAVMGLVEVLRHYPRLYRLRASLLARLLRSPPSVFVGIDVPDFVLAMERRLRAAGVPTVHYVCPQVWAWRANRIPRLAAAADLMLTLFPFEAPFLARHGIRARFVGHPLVDRIPAERQRQRYRAVLDLGDQGPIVALLPGSRAQELRRHADLFLAAAVALSRALPARFVAASANAEGAAWFRARHRAIAPGLPLTIVEGRSIEVLGAADCALVASGTVTLEAALIQTPAVVAYRMAPLSYQVMKRLVRTPHVALPNILLEKRVMPELLQAEATPEHLAQALRQWLSGESDVAAYRVACRRLRAALTVSAPDPAAQAVLSLWREHAAIAA